VGATNCFDSIAIFSSRGPAPDSSPWNNPQYWYRPDWSLTKSDIVAPGVSVRACRPGNSYGIVSGTSSSTPHITGAMAILCEANPNLTITEIYNILLDNADRPSHGGPYPNNNYGWGRLYVYKALQNVLMISENKQVIISRPLMIKPNPNRGRIYFNEKFGDCIIKSYDTIGRLVMDGKYKGINNINIPESIKDGVYFLKMKNFGSQGRSFFNIKFVSLFKSLNTGFSIPYNTSICFIIFFMIFITSYISFLLSGYNFIRSSWYLTKSSIVSIFMISFSIPIETGLFTTSRCIFKSFNIGKMIPASKRALTPASK